jgi:N6-L-threonylcarbamoyladenine synthase
MNSYQGTILGIESSCDETSAAVVTDGELRSVVISSQFMHSHYGGIVPELASRAHTTSIIPIVNEALQKASIHIEDVNAVAVTHSPGLLGSLLVGVNFAKGLSFSLDIPLIGIHHIEAHIFSVYLDSVVPQFPFLALVVSGGHTLLVLVNDIGRYQILGRTLDDAAGEAFDKVGKMMGLGYPAGPVIDKLARDGDRTFTAFPRSMINDGYDFSFSGLKTSVRYYLRDNPAVIDTNLKDVAASFQEAVVEVLVHKTIRAAEEYGVKDIVCTGGVSANFRLREALMNTASLHGKRVTIPKPLYSTDNAAMIALLGSYKLARGIRSPLSLTAVSRSELTAV